MIGAGLIVALGALLLVGPPLASSERGAAGTRATDTARSMAVNEALVRHLTKGRRPVRRKIKYRGVCSVACNVVVRSVLVLPGPDLRTNPTRGSFSGGQVFEAFIALNRRGLVRLKRHRRRARLRAVIRASDPKTGDRDVDRRVFRFKLRRRG